VRGKAWELRPSPPPLSHLRSSSGDVGSHFPVSFPRSSSSYILFSFPFHLLIATSTESHLARHDTSVKGCFSSARNLHPVPVSQSSHFCVPTAPCLASTRPVRTLNCPERAASTLKYSPKANRLLTLFTFLFFLAFGPFRCFASVGGGNSFAFGFCDC